MGERFAAPQSPADFDIDPCQFGALGEPTRSAGGGELMGKAA